MELLHPSWYLGLITWTFILNYICVTYAGYRLFSSLDKPSSGNGMLLLLIFLLIPFTVFVYLYKVGTSKAKG